ncbi:hypothetical protein H6G17_31780 [Chroococcidiopsis sp. FACHB-1243]|uniref:hypothetical protein n=1 Tax=Chroococcidiopsis sp. [FACHB-1243] TaxID=2692781 RepID=UPI00177E0B92|nr:hypothetical protein [Chroococcidiopsis sp. [FACHB-1243]]MBD2309981.1 hypothetical protein [Chroococcidiopsis sp. [FACHB-1243]]
MASSIEDTYPNITRWVNEHEGWIEIGYDLDSPLSSFIRALDSGGMLQGKDSYGSLDEALQELDSALVQVLEEIYGE